MPDYDRDISDMLERLQGTDQDLDAAAALQRFRTEALRGVRDGATKAAKEQLVFEARERLRDALRDLLGWN